MNPSCVVMRCVYLVLVLVVSAHDSDHGACNNDHDMPIAADHNTMHNAMKHCGRSCQGRAGCTTQCLVETLQLGHDCASCFGDEVSCAALHCAAPCIVSSDSDECRTCSDRHCGEAVRQCTGLGDDDAWLVFARSLTADLRHLLRHLL